MAKIEELPTEILTDILYRLRCDYQPPQTLSSNPAVEAMFPQAVLEGTDPEDVVFDPYRKLRNACLVSRRFRDVAQPILFHDFWDDSVSGNLDATVSFAKALYTRPELAKHVSSVAIVPVPAPDEELKPISPAYIKVFEKAIKELGLPQDKETACIRVMKKPNISSLAALVLHQVPHIRTLHVGGGLVMDALEPVMERNPSFLSEVEFLWIDGKADHIFQIGYFEQLVRLPKVRFATFNNGDLFKNKYPSSWGPETLSIEDASFQHCVIDTTSLRKFAKACKKLTSFTYKNFNFTPNTGRFPGRYEKSEFTAAQAQEILRAHSETLEHFQATFPRDPMGPREIQEYNKKCPKVASFRDFPVLKTIFVPHACLPPHPQFSPALEYLKITDCSVSIRDMAAKIAQDCKKGRYPQLKRIEVLSFDISRPIKLAGQVVPKGKSPQQCYMELVELFSGTDVEFIICPYHHDRPNHPDIDFDNDDPFFDLPPPPPEGIRGVLMPAPNGPLPAEMFEGMPPGFLEMLMRQSLEDPQLAQLMGNVRRR